MNKGLKLLLKICNNSRRNTFFSKANLVAPFEGTNKRITKEKLVEAYNKSKLLCESYEPNELVDPKGVFTNNEIDLKEIQVYGFDYDYTLAYYNLSLYKLLFDLARDSLIEHFKYPNGLKNLEYIHDFPIRGLHLHKGKGWLMKVDSYHNIQIGTVYHGLKPVSKEEVTKFFNGTRLNIDDLGHHQTSSTLHHFVDLFCLPEISLLSSTYQYFIDNNIHFNPQYVFQDIHDAFNLLHKNQILHRKIVQRIEDYLIPISNQNNPASSSIYIKEFLNRLKKQNKQVFLITNSPFWFVNVGMTSLCGSDWNELFDVIICSSRKPDFFTSKTKPFRHFNVSTNSKSWEKVVEFKKGNIYYEGNLFELVQYTGWPRHQVLYFGDHIYGDLAEPFLKHGWRTGAIINEIEYEVKIMESPDYQRKMHWLLALEALIEKSMQLVDNDDISGRILREQWLEERENLKVWFKHCYNPYFGSIFRSQNNPTFFSRRLCRFSDIYTSNVTNLLNYPNDYHFIPKRIDLAHENFKSSSQVKSCLDI